MTIATITHLLRTHAETLLYDMPATRQLLLDAAHEIERLREKSHLILSGLCWTGDGYEWTGAEFDYRIKPEESVRMMLDQREAMQAEIKQLRATVAVMERKQRHGCTDANCGERDR